MNRSALRLHDISRTHNRAGTDMNVEQERVLGLLRGALGGVAGLVAMRLFFEAIKAMPNGSEASKDAAEPSDERIERHTELDDISVVGEHSREDEPATETVGRLAHQAATGDAPSQNRKAALGQAVHWGYGVLIGGAYGATRTRAHAPDLPAGLGFGTALWVFGDEIAVPMLGLEEGPTAHRWSDHARALGAHLAYGAATASATQALKRVM